MTTEWPQHQGQGAETGSSYTDLGKWHSMGTFTRLVLRMDRFPTGRGLWSRKVLYTRESLVT